MVGKRDESPLLGERSWRRRGSRSLPDLHDIAGRREPNPISGWGIDPDVAWDGEPEWAGELVGGQIAQGLAADLDEAGWFAPRPVQRRRLRDPGAPPALVRRSTWLARFNPGLSVGKDRVFDDSDPMTFYDWDDPVAALSWAPLSGEPGRTSQAQPHSPSHVTVINLIADMAVGDLVFVLRAQPGDSFRKPVPDPLGWKRFAYLVGVWWVEATVDYPSVDGQTYPLAFCVPLVQFDDPVPVARAYDWVPELRNVSGLKVPGGINAVREDVAPALAAACSLPMEIFTVTNDSLPALAVALRALDTGPVAPMRRYMADASVRYERIRDIEIAAMVAVKDLYLTAGYAVVDVSRTRRIGYDLAVVHPSREDLILQVEVKGTDKRDDNTVTITDHEFAAAQESVAMGDGRWWLYAVTQARHLNFRRLHLHKAHDVHPGWANRVVNPGAAIVNPLRRLAQLPRTAWQTGPVPKPQGG